MNSKLLLLGGVVGGLLGSLIWSSFATFLATEPNWTSVQIQAVALVMVFGVAHYLVQTRRWEGKENLTNPKGLFVGTLFVAFVGMIVGTILGASVGTFLKTIVEVSVVSPSSLARFCAIVGGICGGVLNVTLKGTLALPSVKAFWEIVIGSGRGGHGGPSG